MWEEEDYNYHFKFLKSPLGGNLIPNSYLILSTLNRFNFSNYFKAPPQASRKIIEFHMPNAPTETEASINAIATSVKMKATPVLSR